MKNKLTIILPVYHEEENIENVISGIEKKITTPHIIIAVYDTVSDPTIPIIKKIQRKQKNILMTKNIYGKGVVNAIKTGFTKTRTEYIAIMMADASDNPSDVDQMVKLLDKGYDLICASRYSGGGKRINGPKLKGFLSFFACVTLPLFTGIPTHDATNAFKVFKKEIIDSMKIESKGGFELPLEIAVKAYANDFKITEIPTVWKERKMGKSKFRLFQWLPQYLKWYIFAIKVRFASA